MRKAVLTVVCLCLAGGTSLAGKADVLEVQVVKGPGRSFTFMVTLQHGDEGWAHYADRWEVLTLEGRNLGTRVLVHPHVNEQPFTRSLAGVEVPDGVTRVLVRARDSLHGDGGRQLAVDLP